MITYKLRNNKITRVCKNTFTFSYIRSRENNCEIKNRSAVFDEIWTVRIFSERFLFHLLHRNKITIFSK